MLRVPWPATRRAVFMVALAIAALAVSVSATAQSPGRAPLVGFLPLGSASSAYDQSLVEAFRKGLREAGVVENRDVVLEVVWTSSDNFEISRAVLGLVQRGARVLIPVGTTASMVVKRQAPAMPTLFISVGNPLGIGLVDSLSHPGGNITGFGDFLAELGGKYVQFATEVGRPHTPIYYLWHAGWPDGHYRFQKTEQAANALGVKLHSRSITEITEADDAMAAIKKAGASVVIVQPSPFTFNERDRLIAAATKQGLVTICAFRAAAPAGALITYGPDYADLNRRAAFYLARILKGTKPGELPVEQPTKFELLINRKTAKAVGIPIPPSLLLRADEIIE